MGSQNHKKNGVCQTSPIKRDSQSENPWATEESGGKGWQLRLVVGKGSKSRSGAKDTGGVEEKEGKPQI